MASGDSRSVSGGAVTAVRACGALGSPIAKRMARISYAGCRFPPEIIQQAIWLIFYSRRPHAGHKSLILLNRGEDFAKM
jgi:hypothetical protein